VIQQLDNIVALGALITEWTGYVVIGDERTTNVSLQEFVFTWFWRVS